MNLRKFYVFLSTIIYIYYTVLYYIYKYIYFLVSMSAGCYGEKPRLEHNCSCNHVPQQTELFQHSQTPPSLLSRWLPVPWSRGADHKLIPDHTKAKLAWNSRSCSGKHVAEADIDCEHAQALHWLQTLAQKKPQWLATPDVTLQHNMHLKPEWLATLYMCSVYNIHSAKATMAGCAV